MNNTIDEINNELYKMKIELNKLKNESINTKHLLQFIIIIIIIYNYLC